MQITEKQITEFESNGYMIIRSFLSREEIDKLRTESERQLMERIEPVELESETEYPGAPDKENDPEKTIRRLKSAYQRGSIFQDLASSDILLFTLNHLFQEKVYLVLNHHNCIMTKQPRFSSDSNWHQDIRYWNYTKRELISAWFALGQENKENGGLQVIPGSHRSVFEKNQFDEKLFFRTEPEINQEILKNTISIDLNPGDLLLFHCRLLHAATRNYTENTKIAIVFTYRKETDLPIPNTRSSFLEDIEMKLDNDFIGNGSDGFEKIRN